jgi:hypothetical protein
MLPQRGTALASDDGMAIRVQTSGCLWSILLSIALTVALNLMLRGCSGHPSW